MKTYGSVLKYRLLFFNRVLISDPQLVKQVLLDSYTFNKKMRPYKLLRETIGYGLITIQDEDVHKKHREIITPAFAFKNIKRLVPIFSQKGKVLVSEWLSKKSEEQVNLRYYLSKTTSDVIGEAAFDYKLDSSMRSIFELFKDLFPPFSIIKDWFPLVRDLLPRGFKRKAAIRYLTKEVEGILENKYSKRSNAPSRTHEDENHTRRDILDLLLDCENEHGESLSREELVGHSKNFLLAGYETSSTALLWTMLILSERTDLQEKLAEEVISVLGKDGVPSADDVEAEKMPFLDRVVKESLRWRPPIPTVMRNVGHDTALGEYFLPKGTTIIMSIYAIHHNPQYWTNPDEYDPDRWIGVDEASKFSGTFVPFILGARNCIGSKFALIEIKVLLAMIVQKLRFKCVPGQIIKRKTTITLLPSPDPHVTFSPR